MNKIANIPHGWPEIEAQVREAIIAMASILQTFGPEDDQATVTAFLGQPVEIAERSWMSKDEIKGIDISRHGLYGHARAAWCYAYQVDGWEDFTPEHWHEISCGLLGGGYALTDNQGEPTGLNFLNDLPLRRVFETAFARWCWSEEDSDLTVRELALLSNMAETTVRSSLSKEGFKLVPPNTIGDDKSSYRLPASDALQWLSRRRGFIPNAAAQSADQHRAAVRDMLADLSIPFPVALKRAAGLVGISEISGLGVDPDWYTGLTEGRAVAPDVGALVILADAIDVSRADFAARAVRYLLELENN